MLLSDRDIHEALNRVISTPLIIDNMGGNAIQPASVDLRLGSSIVRNINPFQPSEVNYTKNTARGSAIGIWNEAVSIEHEPYMLEPGEFVIATTHEYVEIPDWLAAKIEGRSSIGRKGLLVHFTAGWIDPGFHGTITLEMANLSRIPQPLTHLMGLSQICFYAMSSPAEKPYGHADLGSKYQDQDGPTLSRGTQS